MTGDDYPYVFTPETLAELWGVSSATVRGLVRSKELAAFRIGRQIRIKPEAVKAYEAKSEAGGLPLAGPGQPEP